MADRFQDAKEQVKKETQDIKTKDTPSKKKEEDDYEDNIWETYKKECNDRYLMEDRERTKLQAKRMKEEEYTYEDYLCEDYHDQCIREDREQSRSRERKR